jgi:hydrogenase maturation protease
MKTRHRVLVAGVGNIFLGDDAFGVEVVQRLPKTLPAGVEAIDFGIRGIDLAYALAGFDAAILVDSVQRGYAPGTLYVLEPELTSGQESPEAHGFTPDRVLRWLDSSSVPRILRLVGCEPESFGPPGIGQEELSVPVRAAVDEALQLVLDLSRSILEQLSVENRPHA